jgi:hypothetical protein
MASWASNCVSVHVQRSCSKSSHRIRLPVILGTVVVQRCQGGSSTRGGQQRASAHLVRCPRCTRAILVVIEGIEVAITLPLRQSPLLLEEPGTPTLWACRSVLRGRWGSLLRRGVDHQHEALLGRRELRNIMLWVGAADMLLHGAIPFFLCAQGVILVLLGCSDGVDSTAGRAAEG